MPSRDGLRDEQDSNPVSRQLGTKMNVRLNTNPTESRLIPKDRATPAWGKKLSAVCHQMSQKQKKNQSERPETPSDGTRLDVTFASNFILQK